MHVYMSVCVNIVEYTYYLNRRVYLNREMLLTSSGWLWFRLWSFVLR